MNANQNNFSLLTQQNKNQNINNSGKKKNLKKVTFKETITIISVPSYKELTKLMCFNEEKEFIPYNRNSRYGQYSHPYYDYKSLYSHVIKPGLKHKPKRHSDSECTCKIL